MERRTFVKGAFGLAVFTAGAGIFGVRAATQAGNAATMFVTPQGCSPDDAAGPLMQPGIELIEQNPNGSMVGRYDGTELFSVDKTGAALIALADGTRSIDAISLEVQETIGMPVSPAEAASFFVTLGQSGYLQNEVFVNLVEVSA